jgi:hypothetical protein
MVMFIWRIVREVPFYTMVILAGLACLLYKVLIDFKAFDEKEAGHRR